MIDIWNISQKKHETSEFNLLTNHQRATQNNMRTIMLYFSQIGTFIMLLTFSKYVLFVFISKLLSNFMEIWEDIAWNPGPNDYEYPASHYPFWCHLDHTMRGTGYVVHFLSSNYAHSHQTRWDEDIFPHTVTFPR